jgi:transposase
MVAMARQRATERLVSDQLWELLEPLIPQPPPAKNGRTGRPRVDDRAALEETPNAAGLRLRNHLLASTTGVAGGRGVGETPPRRASGTEPGGPAGLFEGLPGIGQRPGKKGGELTGPNPTDRAKLGTKYHLLVTADGLPLAVAISGANRHDSILVEPILDRLAPVKGRGRGRPRRRPGKLHADKAYDNRRCAAICAGAGSPPASPGSVWTPANVSADTAGSWNAPSPGCWPSDAWPCATTAARSPSPRWPPWRSPSSASADYRTKTIETISKPSLPGLVPISGQQAPPKPATTPPDHQ